MKALDKKLVRDLWRLKGAALAISLMIASGIGLLVASLNTVDTLEVTRSAYYDRDRFADVFGHLERAPRSLMDRISHIDGVARAEARIRRAAVLDVRGEDKPIRGLILSLPRHGPLLNKPRLSHGRLVSPRAGDEVVLHQAFADAHGFRIGDSIKATLNGTKRELEIVGIATSPEFVYAVPPGQLFPDPAGFGVLWMDEDAMEAAFDLEGAFNDVTLTLMPGAEERAVISRLDALIDPHGGTGAYGRSDQTSHLMLDSEISQIKNSVRILPPIFLGVAAFLANVVMARLVRLERGEIGLLKAFGYSPWVIAGHYLKFVSAVVLIGTALGCVLGVGFVELMTRAYQQVFSFPFMLVQFKASTVAIAMLVATVAAALGAYSAVRRVLALEPAEAMAPEPPADYRPTVVERIGFVKRAAMPARMIVRHIARWPFRAAMTVIGLSMGVMVMIMSGFFTDSFERMIDDFFYRMQRQDLTVTFIEDRGPEAQFAISKLDGVLRAEAERAVPVRLRYGTRAERSGITGVGEGAELTRVYDLHGDEVEMPERGLVLSEGLSELLAVTTGQELQIELLDGKRKVLTAPVTAIVDFDIGNAVYMDKTALDRLMEEGPRVRSVQVMTDPDRETDIVAELKDMPLVVGVATRLQALESFDATIQESMMIMVTMFTFFASLIAVGVVYNSARIALGEQGRELASLMVLGFTRFEAGFILVGELLLLTLVALPIGAALGMGMTAFLAQAMETELYRFPHALSPATVAEAVLVVFSASLISSVMVARRVGTLDLVEVLKTRE